MFAARPFSINVTGETTFQNYPGTFKVKPILNWDEQLTRDGLRRDYLAKGPDQEKASVRAGNQASLLAEINTRVVECPSWWKEHGMGAKLYDDNVVSEVYDAVMKVEADFKAELVVKAEAAKKDLEALVKKDQ